MRVVNTLFCCAALLATSGMLVQGGPINSELLMPTPPVSNAHSGSVAKRDLVDLRILPLGASIVWGLKSSTGNGFRGPLRNQLRWKGYNVDMVGTKFNGNMADNDVEATPGYVIDQIHTASELDYAYKPNLVIINAGTNDCVDNIDVENAHVRLESLIDDLWTNIGDTTAIIVSTILINGVASVNANSAIVNPNYRTLVATLQSQGKPIYLTDLDGWMTIDDIGPDGTHPTDDGYSKMAGAFWQTIAQIDADGKIQAPQAADLDAATADCSKVAGTGVSAGADTQTGSGYDDGIYYHDSTETGTLLTITSQWDRNQWSFARLFNQERDDLLGWINETDGSITYALWRNDGGGVMTKIDDMTNFPNQCIPRGLRFVDLNADGLDDFVCISNPDGALYGVINNGDGGGTSGPTWTSIGLIKEADPNFPQAQVRLADIDGDGRADFIGLDTDGTAHAWRNGGTDDVPNAWQPMGVRWTGGDMGDIAGVRFEDLNGDGRDDWMWVDDDGTVYTFTNSRSCLKGVVGNGLNVAWRQGFYTGKSSGPTHLASFDGDVDRDRIHFARIYGEPAAFSLLGRQDYVYMEHVADGDLHTFNMKVWQNTGSGSAKLKADGDKYADMTGDGRMDYVWSYSGGQMIIFRNGGVDYITSSESYWTQPQEDLFSPQDLIGKDLDRRDLHLSDFDGDGKADIIWVDPDNDNHVSVFINQYDGTTWSWEYQADPAPSLSCSQTKGIGIHDIPIRWGDISGNGRDDYVCIEPDGRMSGYVHETDGSWTYNEQFFGTKGYDRANFQFADVNGDGKVDIIWTEKFSGDGYVYYNDGPMNIAGSSYHWDVDAAGSPAYAYSGNAAGTCTYYPDFNGDGRADQHVILQSFNNIAWTSYNLCTGDHTGDDENPYVDPDLPIPSTTTTTSGSGSGTSPTTTTTPATGTTATTTSGSDSSPTPTFISTGVGGCSGDTTTTDGVQAIMDDVGFVDWLDIMLKSLTNHESDWVDTLYLYEFPDEGASPLSGCGIIDGDCDPPVLCSTYPTKEAYWVFETVRLLHSKSDALRSSLLWTAWIDGLSIDQIAKDFSTSTPIPSWAKWVSAAFSMAGGAATGVDINKPLRGMMGMAGAGFTFVGNSDSTVASDIIDPTSIENTFANIMTAAGNYITRILANGTGNGDSDLLPIVTSSNYEYGTARYFNDPNILLDQNKDNSTYESGWSFFETNLQKKLVNVALEAGWYMLIADRDIDDQSDCNYNAGSLWLEADGKERCFYLTRPQDSSDCSDSDPTTCDRSAWEVPFNADNQMGDGPYTKLIDTYGFNLTQYYLALIDCELNGDGTVDTSTMVVDNGLFRCFYSGYVKQGSWASQNEGNVWYDLVLSDL